MRTVAVAMGKGGTGKTSVSVNLAVGLAQSGARVLLVDLDPTAHATTWLLGAEGIAGAGVADVLRSESVAPGCVREIAGRKGLMLLPATRGLAGAELALASEEGGQAILRCALEERATDWDYAVLDCPPNLGFLSVSALCAAEGVIAPVTCSYLSLSGLGLLQESVARVRRRLGVDCQVLGCLLFAADPRESITAQSREWLRQGAGALLYQAEVRVNTAAKALPARRLTAWDAGEDPRGAADYAALMQETLQRLEGRAAVTVGEVGNG